MNSSPAFLQKYSQQFPIVLCIIPLISAALYPIHPQIGLMIKFMVLLLALHVLWKYTPEQSILSGIIGIIALLYGSSVWSVSPTSTLQGSLQCTYYLFIFGIFSLVPIKHRDLLWAVRLLVCASLVLAVYGLYQYVYGFEDYLHTLDSQTTIIPQAMQELTRSWLVTLSGRVFSTFALPSQFAGYLLMILPFHFFLLIYEPKMRYKVFWAGPLLFNSLMFWYTKSFGAWLSLLAMMAGAGVLLLVWHNVFSWRKLLAGAAAVGLLGISVIFLIGWVRGQHLWNFQGNNPLWFRWLNWKAALGIWRDHIFLGSGFHTFGKMYPQYMVAGANEAQYAHNTYLQIGAELGLIGAIVVFGGVVYWLNKNFQRLHSLVQRHLKNERTFLSPAEFLGICTFFSGLGFLTHNVIDFDAYIFPLGLMGSAFLALTGNLLSGQSRRNRVLRLVTFKGRALYGLAVCLVIVMYGSDWQYINAAIQKEQAVTDVQTEAYRKAHAHIQQALQYLPQHPEYTAIEGSILMYLDAPAEAIPRLQAAIQREPMTPWFHAALAEAYLAEQNVSMAYLESRRAADLFPQKPIYQQRAQEIRKFLPDF